MKTARNHTGLAMPFLLTLLTPWVAPAAQGMSSSEPISRVPIAYFYEAGCKECITVSNEVLPELQARFEGFYVLDKRDITTKSNYMTLVRYQEALGMKGNEPVCMIVDHRFACNGLKQIRDNLLTLLDQCVQERLAGITVTGRPPVAAMSDDHLLEQRVQRFSLPAVGVAGLLDGINPCAVGTLVFFLSLLVVSGIRGGRLIAVGASFCLASFITYTAIGFGLLHGLKVLQGYRYAQMGIDWVMIAVLAVLAFLSFRDAYRFKQTGRAGDVVLQLPARIKQRIHLIMRSGLKFGNLLVGGLFIGALVTVLESVCTGQVYLPTLVAVIKSGHSGGRAWSYLLLYNAMFIVPLVAVLILAYFGLKTETLIEWSRRNVVPSKILLGFLFVALAVLILAL